MRLFMYVLVGVVVAGLVLYLVYARSQARRQSTDDIYPMW
jgi:hypothetical protein